MTRNARDARTEDQKELDRWLRSSAVIATLFVAMLAIVFLSNQLHPRAAGTDLSASKLQTGTSQVQELMKTIDLNKLPNQQINDPI